MTAIATEGRRPETRSKAPLARARAEGIAQLPLFLWSWEQAFSLRRKARPFTITPAPSNQPSTLRKSQREGLRTW